MNEIELIQKLNEFRNLPAETEIVEFKEAKNDFSFEKIGKYFSALSNEANLKGKTDAWLIFGVRDKDRSIVGSNYRQSRALLDELKAKIANKISNRLTFIEIYELKLPEGRVVLFQIPAAPQGLPVAWEGHFYGRDGEESSSLNLEEIERIRKQVTYFDWSAVTVNNASIADLEPTAIEKARENYKVKNPRLQTEIETWDTTTFLTKTKILVDGKLTRAALILLGKKESAAYLQPARVEISWVLYTKEKVERDYEHFFPPYIMSVDEVYKKIRNLKYRYMKEGTLFPEEVEQYDIENIKEALSNCIAHMDYSTGGRIGIAENEDGYLSFINPGSFLPGSIDKVINSEEPPSFNRNALLAATMVGFNMIDSIGSGIKRMFRVQRQRLFPMPDYELSDNKVKVTLYGKVLDMDYARALVRNPDLDLEEIIMLDKVQKKKTLTDYEIKKLKERDLIEGRKPNFHISAGVAEKTGQKEEYIRNRAFKDQHYKDLILDYINKYKSATKGDIDKLVIEILPAVLNNKQKENKVRNLVYAMSKKDKTILNEGTIRYPKWVRKMDANNPLQH